MSFITRYYLNHADEIESIDIPRKLYDTYDQAYEAKRERLMSRRDSLLTELAQLNQELDEL